MYHLLIYYKYVRNDVLKLNNFTQFLGFKENSISCSVKDSVTIKFEGRRLYIYGRFLPATTLSGCQITLMGVLLLLSFLIQGTKHSQI